MVYKKCEHCGEEIHIRSKKCPFCNQTVAEVEIVEEENENLTEENVTGEASESVNENPISSENPFPNENEAINYDANNMSAPPHINFEVGANGQPKDYIYKAEVRHSLEYTTPLSNTVKVFIAALCTIPVIGQFIGSFIGVFFSTYDDSDRKSFGRAIILLSICMVIFYLAYIRYAMQLLGNVDLNELYNTLGM